MRWTPIERAQFVRDFLASGETQAEFCAHHHSGAGGPSPRTFRVWLAAHTKPSGARAEVRDIIARALRDIEAVLQVFDGHHGLDTRATERVLHPESASANAAEACGASSRARAGVSTGFHAHVAAPSAPTHQQPSFTRRRLMDGFE
jgi:hypothetical protein